MGPLQWEFELNDSPGDEKQMPKSILVLSGKEKQERRKRRFHLKWKLEAVASALNVSWKHQDDE